MEGLRRSIELFGAIFALMAGISGHNFLGYCSDPTLRAPLPEVPP